MDNSKLLKLKNLFYIIVSRCQILTYGSGNMILYSYFDCMYHDYKNLLLLEDLEIIVS